MMTAPEEKLRPRQARELARRLGLLTEAQAAAGWAVIIILGALLGVIYLNQTAKIATIGRRIQGEQAVLDELKRQNAELEQMIAEAQSLEVLDAAAVRLGFVRAAPDQIEYIAIPNYPMQPAQEPEVVVTPVALPEPPDTFWEALTLTIRDLGVDLTRGETDEQ